MSAELQEFQLGSRCSVKSSKRIFAKEYVEEGIPFWRSKDVIDKALGSFSNYELFISEERFREIKKTHGCPQRGDILISSVGNRSGQAYVVQDEGDFHFKDGNILWLSGFEGIDSEFLAYWLTSDVGQTVLSSVMIGSAQKALTIDALKKLWVQLPPINYQSLAVNVLKGLDQKISVNKGVNRTLEQMAQAIFKSWFVDFEPVKAKIAALEAGGTEEDALLAAMQAISGKDSNQLDRMQAEQPEQYAELRAAAELFPSDMQNSELGEMPLGWDALPLSNMVELIGGGTPKKSEPNYWGGNICWFSVKDAPNEGNVFVIDTEEKITESGLKGSSTKLLPVGTTIITARGTVGKLALTGVITAMNQSCYGVVGKDGTGPYLNYLRLNLAVDTLKRNTHGAVFDTITRTTFDTVVQPQADLELRNRFEETVRPVFEAIRINLHQIKTLSNIRDTLLPKLLSGELTLPDTAEPDTKAQEVALA